MLKIAILGYGKLGQAIGEAVQARGHELILTIRSSNLADLAQVNQADVAIDCSTPDHAFNNIQACLNSGVPIVSGTTGWLDKRKTIEEHCQKVGGAFLYASNFSIGVNLFFALNKQLATLMNGQRNYQISLDETHHIQKADAPSGTAISLAEGLIGKIDHKKKWVNQASKNDTELSIQSRRQGEVPGTHQVNYTSAVDSISICHTAHNRKGFALGAALAAEWLADKKGCFSMQDLLIQKQ